MGPATKFSERCNMESKQHLSVGEKVYVMRAEGAQILEEEPMFSEHTEHGT